MTVGSEAGTFLKGSFLREARETVERGLARLTSGVFDCEIPSSNRSGRLAHFALGPRWWDVNGESRPEEFVVATRWRNRAKRRALENPPRIQSTYEMLR